MYGDPFCFWKRQFLEVISDFVCLRGESLWWHSSSKEFDFLGTELTLGFCQTQSCFSDALEDLAPVGFQLLGVVGGYPDVVDILSAFVSFNDSWDFPSWTSRRKRGICWALVQVAGMRLSDKQIQRCQQLDWFLVCRLREQSEERLQKNFLPARCWAASESVLTGWLLFILSSAMRLLIFLKSTGSQSLPISFLCAKIGLACLMKGSVVIIPKYCIGANSTVKSSFRWQAGLI